MDEGRRIMSARSSAESINFVRFDTEQSVALRKVLSVTIVTNFGLLVLAACLFGLIRYDGRLLAEEAAQSRRILSVRDLQLAKLTSALSGQARFNISALNTNSRLLLENYGGFLPRQGNEYAKPMKKAHTTMERLRPAL